ncbi:MAG TPA: aromatic ring-hydroxylating dioxygenase subunit alpha [Acidimicrobiales bacterium]|nr:aromatic ring-hydroxylating dioxygenase subunit alpha [Acidimicrobiales bacterium]
MACREEEVEDVGDFVEYIIADQSYVVIRSSSGTIKAYPNACLHRGTQLKQGRGTATEFRCSFHAWCWELDGTCREILDPGDFGDPDLADLRLPECAVATWAGFVFINPDPDGIPFEEWIAPVAERTDAYRMEDMRYVSLRSTIVPANWKVGVEAFIESYHIFGTHPQAVLASDGTYAMFDGFGEHGRMIVPMGRPTARIEIEDESEILDEMVPNLIGLAKLPKAQVDRLRRIADGIEDLEGRPLRDVLIEMGKERAIALNYDDSRFSESQYWDQHEWHVFPNLVLGIIPGEVFGFRFRPWGLDPDASVFEVLSLRFPDESYEKAQPVEIPYSRDPDERRQTWGPILHQDFSNLEKVQRGLHSTSLQKTRISGYQEQLIARYHKVIDQYLTRYQDA